MQEKKQRKLSKVQITISQCKKVIFVAEEVTPNALAMLQFGIQPCPSTTTACKNGMNLLVLNINQGKMCLGQ